MYLHNMHLFIQMSQYIHAHTDAVYVFLSNLQVTILLTRYIFGNEAHIFQSAKTD